MHAILTRARQFLVAEDGPTTVEYAVMLALVVAVVITVVAAVGTGTRGLFQDFNQEFDDATGGSG